MTNIPTYKFNTFSEPNLIRFLQEVKEIQKLQKYEFHDYDKNNVWKTFVKLDPYLESKKEICLLENSDVIEISDDEELRSCSQEQLLNTFTSQVSCIHIPSANTSDGVCIEDLSSEITECLERLGIIPEHIQEILKTCSEHVLKGVFKILIEALNGDQMAIFGESFCEFDVKENLMQCFVKELLIPNMIANYNENLQAVFLKLCEKFRSKLIEILLLTLQSKEQVFLDIFLQYVVLTKPLFKITLLREFLLHCHHPEITSLLTIEALLNNHVDVDSLKKIVELMSNCVDNNSNNKQFGKLLFNVVQLLGKNVVQLEQPLKHILGAHRSIYKGRAQKIVDSHVDGSLFLSQSTLN